MSSQRVIVDDTSHWIQYTGAGWFRDNSGSQDNIGNLGPTYQHTLHGTNVNGSLSFSFQGTGVTVLGSNGPKNASDVANLTWECFVDNVSIGAILPQFHGNNQELCGTHMLEDGHHELTINVTTSGQIFWLDSIQYLPSPMSLFKHGLVLRIDHTDPNIIYDSEWHALGNIANITQTFGSTASFNFTGTGLSWVGLVPQNAPLIPSRGTYSIDGGPQVPFLLSGSLSGNGATQFNQVFFSTPKLSDSPHTLRVIYQGNNLQTPLTLEYLYVFAKIPRPFITTRPPWGASPGADTSQPSAMSTSRQPNQDHVGAIVGGVVGGVFLVIVCLGLLWWYRRRQRYTALRNPTVTWRPDFKVDPTMRAYNHGVQAGGSINSSLPSLDATGFEKTDPDSQLLESMLQHTTPRRLSSDTVLSGYGLETMMQTRELRKYHETITPL